MPTHRRLLNLILAASSVLVLLVFAALAALAQAGRSAAGNGSAGAPSSKPLLVWAVGDGPNKNNKRAGEVAKMIVGSKPNDVLYLGDVYQTGSTHDFKSYYDPTYGAFAKITYPTPGNHELESSPPLGGYDSYWGKQRPSVLGKNKLNLYAANLGKGWRLLDLTSAFVLEGGGPGEEDRSPGPQVHDVVKFVRHDLATHKGTCYIAIMHRPRFSAGAHGDQDDLAAVWDSLNGRTSLLLQGHEHEYFRLDLSSIPGAHNTLPGAQSFVVGTGGVRLSKTISKSYTGLKRYWVAPSAKDKGKKKYYGALRLKLSSGNASYSFINLDGKTIDSGSLGCTPVSKSP